MLLKLFDVWTDLSHFSPWKCCFYNGYTSCKYYFIHLAVFLWKKVPFVIILTGSSQKPSKPTQTYYIFYFFSRLEHGTCTSPLSNCFLQLTNIRGIPIAQEPYVSWWNLIFSFKLPHMVIFCSYVACDCTPI